MSVRVPIGATLIACFTKHIDAHFCNHNKLLIYAFSRLSQLVLLSLKLIVTIKMPLNPAKRALEAPDNPFKRAKRTIKPTLKAREGDGTQQSQHIEPIEPPSPPPTQSIEPSTPPIELPNDSNEPPNDSEQPTDDNDSEQPADNDDEVPQRASPRQVLSIAASQATQEQPFELRLLNLVPERAIVHPNGSSRAATEATLDENGSEVESELPPGFVDNLDGIDFKRLPGYCKPNATTKRGRSWIFLHGYRIAKQTNITECWWLCKYCHQHKIPGGLYKAMSSTSAANGHLAQLRAGHRLTKDGPIRTVRPLFQGQSSLTIAQGRGVEISQEVANELGHFDVHGFRLQAILWLIDNNHPLREFENPSFRSMLRFANPEAEAALWRSRTSVATFAMKPAFSTGRTTTGTFHYRNGCVTV